VKLGKAERTLRKAEKAAQLQEGVDAIMKLRDDAIKDLAGKLCVHEKVIQNLVNAGTHYVKHRRPGAFNALVHKAAGEMNNGKFPFFSPRVGSPDLGLLQTLIPDNASSSKKSRIPYYMGWTTTHSPKPISTKP
jgi:hypothetical protein